MANKKITDLVLISSVDGSESFPVDDAIQTYRATITQVKNFILATGNVVRSMIEENERIPIGSVNAFAGTVAPSGWLICDGSAVSRTTYETLFNLVGSSFGEGDGSTTFNLPDLRGRFVRGLDDGAGRDPDAGSRTAMNTGGNTGDNIGSIQDEELNGSGLSAGSSGSAHTHELTVDSSNVASPSYADGGGTIVAANTKLGRRSSGGSPLFTVNDAVDASSDSQHTHPISGGGSETRPVNAYMNYIIKF